MPPKLLVTPNESKMATGVDVWEPVPLLVGIPEVISTEPGTPVPVPRPPPTVRFFPAVLVPDSFTALTLTLSAFDASPKLTSPPATVRSPVLTAPVVSIVLLPTSMLPKPLVIDPLLSAPEPVIDP